MYILFFITTVILFIFLVSLSLKYKKLKQTFRNHKKSLRSILKTINSVRYGNLFERVNPASFVLLPNFSESINRMIEAFVDRENMINEYQNIYRTMVSGNEIEKEILKQNNIIEAANKKKSKLLQLVTNGSITDNDFRELMSQCNLEIKNADDKLKELKDQEESSKEFKEHMDNIIRTLKLAEKDVANGKITKEFIDTFIDKIFVTPISHDTMQLSIKIFTGDKTDKYLKKIRHHARDNISDDDEGSMGHTFLIINPIRNTDYISFERTSRIKSNHKVRINYNAKLCV